MARAWHVDVARYLIEQGADVNKGDKFGRTPLHTAAAVDYVDMVNLLIEKKGRVKTIIVYFFVIYSCASLIFCNIWTWWLCSYREPWSPNFFELWPLCLPSKIFSCAPPPTPTKHFSQSWFRCPSCSLFLLCSREFSQSFLLGGDGGNG